MVYDTMVKAVDILKPIQSSAKVFKPDAITERTFCNLCLQAQYKTFSSMSSESRLLIPQYCYFASLSF